MAYDWDGRVLRQGSRTDHSDRLFLVRALMNNKYSFHVVLLVLICNTLESNTLDEGIHTVLIHVDIQMLPLFIPLLEHMLRSKQNNKIYFIRCH